jgi:hypothetical protein
MRKLEGTTACKMRDELWSKRSKTFTPTVITNRLTKIGIPAWLRSQIIQMVRYNEMDRCTDAIEQAMYQSVCNLIVKELMDAEKKVFD